jgi:methylthioribose-1-phosphate isomerase
VTVAAESIRWDGVRLAVLDQRRLPEAVTYLDVHDLETLYAAIRDLAVRGAPAIGIAAAYGIAVALAAHQQLDRVGFLARLDAACERIATARPTAVNLAWAARRMRAAGHASAESAGRALLACLRREAEAIHAEDRAICRAIGEAAVHLIVPGSGVLTHCNAGALAVSALGTATAPLYLAHARGTPFRVYVDETRPLLQGSRLTAWELERAGLDVTVICDNAAARLMSEGLVQLVIVGTDRVTANGDVVNKIGTLGLAILCRHFGIPFYVACPSSTFDAETLTGAEVVIEERDGDEVRTFRGTPAAPARVKVRNPAFDVTPYTLVTAIVTDRGLVGPPFAANLAARLGASVSASSGGRSDADARAD